VHVYIAELFSSIFGSKGSLKFVKALESSS